MSDPIPVNDSLVKPPREWLRMILLLVLLLLGSVAYYVLFHTLVGHHIRHRDLVRAWVAQHRLIAPLIFLAVYVIASILMLPVWWVQVLAGYCFGLVVGIAWCELGAVLGAMASVQLSRWLVGQWFQARYESRMARLRHIDESLGSNGLLVVLAVRLCHVTPFGLSNYLFGLTRIKTLDAGLGTLAGNFPSIALSVAIGANRGYLSHWRFWVALIGINLLLLAPVAMRYQRRHGRAQNSGQT